MSNPIDTKVISKLAEILDKSNLTELEYEDEGCRISEPKTAVQLLRLLFRLRCPLLPLRFRLRPLRFRHLPPVSAPAGQAEDYSKSPNAVKSPMVGVVYLSADPNTPNYVKVGDSVKEGDIVCLIEAMKTFNPVKAHKNGTVAKILVEGGDPVEYGEPLVIIE